MALAFLAVACGPDPSGTDEDDGGLRDAAPDVVDDGPCVTVAECNFYNCQQTSCVGGACYVRPDAPGTICNGTMVCDGAGLCVPER